MVSFAIRIKFSVPYQRMQHQPSRILPFRLHSNRERYIIPIVLIHSDFRESLWERAFMKSPYHNIIHPELNGGRMGIAGDPIPYLVSNDSVMTGVLLAFVILTILVVSRSMRFIAYQFKNFMYPGHSYESIEYKETAGEVNYQFFLCFQTVVLLSLSCYYCLVDSTTETYVVDTYQLLGLFFLSVFGIFMLKEYYFF